MKLAEALLRRKELNMKVQQLHSLKQGQVYEPVLQRRPVGDGYDEITGNVPKLNASQVTAEYDHYSKQLRLIDAAIQQVNWTTEMDGLVTEAQVMQDYAEACVNVPVNVQVTV